MHVLLAASKSQSVTLYNIILWSFSTAVDRIDRWYSFIILTILHVKNYSDNSIWLMYDIFSFVTDSYMGVCCSEGSSQAPATSRPPPPPPPPVTQTIATPEPTTAAPQPPTTTLASSTVKPARKGIVFYSSTFQRPTEKINHDIRAQLAKLFC